MIKTSIIDDDEFSRFVLKKHIDNTNFLVFHKAYDSALKALEDEEINEADLIILDVEMPGLSGIDFLNKSNIKAKVIITSINCDYAVKAFDFDVVDFLAKPVEYARFLQSVHRVQERLTQDPLKAVDDDHFFIRCKNGFTRINYDDILYVEAYSDYMNIHTTKERLTALATMKSIEEKLPNSKFVRVHRSYLVNLDKINRYEDNLVVIGDKIIPVSRSCKENLMKRLNFF